MVTTFYPPYHFGGDATYVRALSQALARRGHEVTVVHCEDAYRLKAAQPVENEEPGAGIKVHRLKTGWGSLSPLITQQFGHPGLKRRKVGEVLGGDYDVVNFHNISLVGGPGIIGLSNATINLYTLHEHWLLCPTHIFWKNREKACESRQCFICSIKSRVPPQLWRYTSLLKKSIGKIDTFISPSHYTAEQHRQGGITQPIKVLPLFSGLTAQDNQDGLETRNSFIFVGRVTASKGIIELLHSFSKWPNYKLQVIGEGDLLDKLRDQYRSSANISFLGQIPQQALADLYRKAVALILPSLAPETFGLSIVEAHAFSVPAIVRIAGGNREIIDTSGAGMLYENEGQLKEAVETLHQNADLRQRLGCLAFSAFQQYYTETAHVDRYLKLIAQIKASKQASQIWGGGHVQ